MGKSYLLFFIASLSFFQAKAQSKAEPTQLVDFSRIKHFQWSIEPHLRGVVPFEGKVWTFVPEGRFYIESTYNESAKEPELGFGTLKNPLEGSERINLAEGEKERRLRGVLPWERGWLYLDSKKYQWLVWDEQKKLWLTPVDVIMDLMRPPLDRKGEAPSAEVQRLRGRFLKEFRLVKDDRDFFLGAIPLPKFWKDADGSQALVLMKHREYPLATVRCQLDKVRECRLMRACFIPSLSTQEVEQLAGLAYRDKNHELWMLSHSPPRIRRYQAESCLRVKFKDEVLLPKELRKVSGIAIDAKDKLWLTTQDADLEHSASLFVFDIP